LGELATPAPPPPLPPVAETSAPKLLLLPAEPLFVPAEPPEPFDPTVTVTPEKFDVMRFFA
jgi:hypothetical protein